MLNAQVSIALFSMLIIVVGGVVGIVIIVTYLPIFNFGAALAQ